MQLPAVRETHVKPEQRPEREKDQEVQHATLCGAYLDKKH